MMWQLRNRCAAKGIPRRMNASAINAKHSHDTYPRRMFGAFPEDVARCTDDDRQTAPTARRADLQNEFGLLPVAIRILQVHQTNCNATIHPPTSLAVRSRCMSAALDLWRSNRSMGRRGRKLRTPLFAGPSRGVCAHRLLPQVNCARAAATFPVNHAQPRVGFRASAQPVVAQRRTQ